MYKVDEYLNTSEDSSYITITSQHAKGSHCNAINEVFLRFGDTTFLFLERAYLVYQIIDKTKLSKTNFPKQNPRKH